MSYMDAEVIVVGAGPSGITAAKNLASHGISVLILEKLSFPRKVICSDIIFYQAVKDFPYIEPMIESYNYSVEIRSNKQTNRVVIDSKTPFFATFSDRARFDSFLLENAQHPKLSIKFNVEVNNVKSYYNFIVVHTNQGCFRANMVIGADSINSIVARRLNIGLKPFPSQFGLSINQLFPLDKKTCIEHYGDRLKATLLLNYNQIPGITKIVPKLNSVLVEISTPISRYPHIRKDFEKLIQDLIEWRDLPNLEFDLHPTIGVFPIQLAEKRTYGPRCLLVGNAGGFCSSLFGMGIYHSMLSGLYASQAVQKMLNSPLYAFGVVPPYYRIWQKNLRSNLKLHQRIRNLILLNPAGSVNFVNWIKNNPSLHKRVLNVIQCDLSAKISPAKLSWLYYRSLRKR
ncbi:FAD-dependent monooxygenase [Candidatus Lokiarchaeum ossiferum]